MIYEPRMNSKRTFVDVVKLYKDYENIRAVDNVSFSINKGEIFGLLGSNGAGKTTIIQMIAGLLQPTNGKILVDGYDVNSEPLKVKALLGYLPETPALYERLTGREYLNFIGRLRNIDENTLRKKIDAYTKKLELGHRINTRLSAYSKGERQKVSFMGSILHEPELLLLDEPTSGLDPRFGLFIKDWIKKRREQKKTVLVSTHITSIAELLCDRVIIIHRGKVLNLGTITDLLETTKTSSLEECFVKITGGRIEFNF